MSTGWKGIIETLVVALGLYLLLVALGGMSDRLDRHYHARVALEQEVFQLRTEVDCLYKILGYEPDGLYALAKHDCDER